MNRFTRAAQAREAAAYYAFRPRRPVAHAFRVLAILTTVLLLWAVSFEACYRWLAPTLVGAP